MASRLEIFFECDPAWKAVFFFLLFERGKNTENAEQFFEICISELQVNVRGEDRAAFSFQFLGRLLFGLTGAPHFQK